MEQQLSNSDVKQLITGREQSEDSLEADSYNLDCCGQELIEIESLPRRVSVRREKWKWVGFRKVWL